MSELLDKQVVTENENLKINFLGPHKVCDEIKNYVIPAPSNNYYSTLLQVRTPQLITTSSYI